MLESTLMIAGIWETLEEWGWLGAVVILAGVILVVLMLLALYSIRKVPPGKAGVRVGLTLTGGKFVISDTVIYKFPLITRLDMMDISVQKLEIERKGQDGLICQDNIRADIVVAFYIKVNYPKVDYQGVDPTFTRGAGDGCKSDEEQGSL